LTWASRKSAAWVDDSGPISESGVLRSARYVKLPAQFVPARSRSHVRLPEEDHVGEMKERMLHGELYIAEDEDLAADFGRAQEILERYNR
jgi:hypothetical protein